MRIAIIAATPFQIFNAINLSYNIIGNQERKDLFYRNFTPYTNEIFIRLQKTQLFSHIYEFNLVSKSNSIKYYINDFVQATQPSKFIQELLKEDIDLSEKKYDYITITSGTEFETAMTRIFPDAKTIAYDDGLGSYIGDIVHDQKLNFIWRILGRRTNRIKPECLYVNNTRFCESRLAKSIKSLCPINEWTKEYKNMLSFIFGMPDENVYQNRKIIYLGQPLNEIESGLDETNTFIEKVLSSYNNQILYRKHPRQSQENINSFYMDTTECIWELICENYITDNHILISLCSSTQIMPKVLFNKEPWLIFTYKIFNYKNKTIYENRFLPIIEKIKKEYKLKYKVLEPESLEQLENALNIIIHR